jgi:hypothetical protein
LAVHFQGIIGEAPPLSLRHERQTCASHSGEHPKLSHLAATSLPRHTRLHLLGLSPEATFKTTLASTGNEWAEDATTRNSKYPWDRAVTATVDRLEAKATSATAVPAVSTCAERQAQHMQVTNHGHSLPARHRLTSTSMFEAVVNSSPVMSWK